MFDNVLNPRLYAALERAFGEVLVSDQGSPRTTVVLPVWSRGISALTVRSISNGEYYRVSCPFCAMKKCWDTRFRLWINHEWALVDERTQRRNLHLAYCFNEQCLQESDRRRELYNLVYPVGQSRHARPLPTAPIVKAAPAQAILFPPECVRLDYLGLDHPASQYLIARGFDPHALARQWGVCYCSASMVAVPTIRHRIVVPIVRPSPFSMPGGPPGIFAGWQARTVNDADQPKYLTAQGLRKSEIFYGLPSAVHSTGPIVIVEGVTDVWRLGTNAIAPLGRTLSLAQEQVLRGYFPGRPIVLMLDADAEDQARKACASLRRARTAAAGDNRVVVAQLPPGRKDVAECTVEEAWQAVWSSLGGR